MDLQPKKEGSESTILPLVIKEKDSPLIELPRIIREKSNFGIPQEQVELSADAHTNLNQTVAI